MAYALLAGRDRKPRAFVAVFLGKKEPTAFRIALVGMRD